MGMKSVKIIMLLLLIVAISFYIANNSGVLKSIDSVEYPVTRVGDSFIEFKDKFESIRKFKFEKIESGVISENKIKNVQRYRCYFPESDSAIEVNVDINGGSILGWWFTKSDNATLGDSIYLPGNIFQIKSITLSRRDIKLENGRNIFIGGSELYVVPTKAELYSGLPFENKYSPKEAALRNIKAGNFTALEIAGMGTYVPGFRNSAEYWKSRVFCGYAVETDVISGTSDSVLGKIHREFQKYAWSFATEYNKTLMEYMKANPKVPADTDK